MQPESQQNWNQLGDLDQYVVPCPMPDATGRACSTSIVCSAKLAKLVGSEDKDIGSRLGDKTIAGALTGGV